MKYKVPLALGGAAAVIGASSVIAFADTSTTSGSHEGLVDKIANTFHLNKDDVQKVFDQNRQEHQAQMEQNYSAKLDQAVKDGKITADQKATILAKHQEVVSFMDSLKDKTPQERRDAMKTEHEQLQQWAKDNNIPLGLIMPMHRGMGMGHGMNGPDNDADDSSASINNSSTN